MFVSGDTLNISVVRTWEFQQSYPLRSVVLLHLIYSPVFKILSFMDETTSFHITGYSLLVSYRFMMSILSLWIDICIFKICKIIGLNGYSSNILFAGSYVTLTFQTHTFTNSFETVHFVSLILLIFICIREDEECKWKKCGIKLFTKIDERKDTLFGETVRAAAINDENEIEDDFNSSFNELHKLAFHLRKRKKSADMNDRRNEKDENSKDEVVPESYSKQQKMQSTNTSKSTNQTSLYMYIGLLAVTVTAGIFNRPTFISYCTLPLLWWTDKYLVGSINIIKRVTLFMFTGIALSLIFVAIDSAYFIGMEVLSLFSLDGLRKVCQSYVVTPFNFFMYNSVTSNLESHGHHPCYVHLFFNMPLLFGPMLIYLGKPVLSKIITARKVLLSSVGKEKKLPAEGHVSVEERLKTNLKEAITLFVFFPVVVLSFFPHQEARFLIPLLPLVVISVVLFSKRIGKLFWTIFVIFNVLFSVLFGVLHQGGVVPCLLKLQDFVENDQNSSSFTLIFSHTYMPPKHLLLTRSQKLEILDLKGADLQTVFTEIDKCRHSFSNLTDRTQTSKRRKVLLVMPGTFVSEFRKQYDNFFSFKSEEKFFPHLSFEDPPDLKNVNCFVTFFDMLSLYLIEIE